MCRQKISEWISESLVENDPVLAFKAVIDRVLEEGIPVARCSVVVRTPHPTLAGQRFTWRKESGVEVTLAPLEIMTSETYTRSPAALVFEHGETVRRRICDGEGIDEFPLLRELHEEHRATDYLAFPLTFLGGDRHMMTWTCFEPGGFSESHIETLLSIQTPFSRIAQIFALRRTSENLMNAFLGPGTGERVFQGRCHLGDSDRIASVICFCDLRGSTSLAESYDMEQFLAVLNEFYACTATPIQKNGGEILRFIGDAFLAIFPIHSFMSLEDACRSALASVEEAKEFLFATNVERINGGQPGFECGFGLHVGEVLWGNIGIQDRLEFTVIGPAANEAARLESLCRETGEPVLVSEQFTDALPGGEWRDMGQFALRNVRQPMRVFAPLGR